VSSLAPLRSRLARLEEEVRRQNQRANTYSAAAKPVSTLPGVSNWPAFARKTWIRTSGTVAQFDPYHFQIELVRAINAAPNTIVNKSRQMGVSETVASYLLCRALTERGFAAVVFSKTQSDASELGRRVRAMANSIVGESFKYLTDSTTQIAFEGRGTLYFLPASPRAARGIPSGSVLWLDEAAFLDGAAEIYRGAMPVLSMLGDAAKVIITSTPDTEVDFFGGLWHQGIPTSWYDHVKTGDIDGLNTELALIKDDWNRIAIHYSQHPVYSKDPDWADKTRESRRMTRSAWASEYELAFGATDTQVYPTALVTRAARGHWRECGVVNRHYVVGIDPNAGGNDYFVALVLDISKAPFEVVGMFRENGKSTEYSLQKVRNLIEDYMPQRVVVEKQAMGQVIAEVLQGILPTYAIETFSTSRPSKLTATDRVLYLLERDELIFPPGIIPAELRSFQHKEGGSREAAAGTHDDTVMALAMACSLIPETQTISSLFDNL